MLKGRKVIKKKICNTPRETISIYCNSFNILWGNLNIHTLHADYFIVFISSNLQNEEDLPYEEEILRNPFSVKHWLRYIEHKKNAPKAIINTIYERSLKELPGRYDLKISLENLMNISRSGP